MMSKSLSILETMLGVLCLVGTAYAHWEKTIYISGYARTGTLDFIWADVGTSDDYAPLFNEDQTAEDGFITRPPIWDTDKDVAWAEAWVDAVDPHYMYVHIHDGYPSYAVMVTTHIDVRGTIPIHVYQIIFRDDLGNIVGTYEYMGDQVVQMDLDGDLLPDVEIMWNAIFDDPYWQLHPGDYKEVSFYIHIMNNVQFYSQYKFSVEITGCNYNECLQVVG